MDAKVLYIISSGRSGSTILGNVLGGLDGYFHAGELRTLWGKGLLKGRRCGCGVPVRECEVWASVLKVGFGDPWTDEVDPVQVAKWQDRAVRMRHTPRLLRMKPGGPYGLRPVHAYTQVATRLYGAVAEVTGAPVIVDSSKRPAHAALLRLVPGVDATFVHLVRDPRAQAYSWRRRKANPGRGRREEMIEQSPFTSTRGWVARNVLAEAVRRRHGEGRSMLVRYEDFVARPRATIEAITELVGERPERLPFVDDFTVALSANHTAGGNPDRFGSGLVRLREDREWLTTQRAADRLVATALALPMLRRYGYPLFPKRRSPGPS